MASLANIHPPLHAIIAGYPGSGKTGSLACLANAGFKLRIISFDKMANIAPLEQHTKPECLDNIDALFFEDQLSDSSKFIGVKGLPTAFADAFRAMDKWAYKEDGVEVDLGRSRDWGPDTVVVLDNLTSMGEAGFRRAMAALGKTSLNTTQQLWGLAMKDQAAFLERAMSNKNQFHFIALSHLKMVGPKDLAKDDDALTKELKERAADLIPTRLYPTALGQELPRNISGQFSTAIEAERQVDRLGKEKRVLKTVSGAEFDSKVPTRKSLPATLPVEDGLLTILEAVCGPKEKLFEAAQKFYTTQGKET